MKDKIKSPKLSDAEKAAEMERLGRQHDFYLIDGNSRTPITLTSLQRRIMCALVAFISRPEELECNDVKRKLSAPFKSLYDVSRYIPAGWLAQVIYGSNSRDNRETILEALYNLRKTYQHFDLSDGSWEETYLIATGPAFGKVKGKGKDKEAVTKFVKIAFGGQIFVDINNADAQLQAAWDIIIDDFPLPLDVFDLYVSNKLQKIFSRYE